MVGSCQRLPDKPVLRPGFSNSSLGWGLLVLWPLLTHPKNQGPSLLYDPPGLPAAHSITSWGLALRVHTLPALAKAVPVHLSLALKAELSPRGTGCLGCRTGAPPVSGHVCEGPGEAQGDARAHPGPRVLRLPGTCVETLWETRELLASCPNITCPAQYGRKRLCI